MTYFHYERLTAMDAAFLGIEDGSSHMHIGSVALFEAAPLQRPNGGIDIDRIFKFSEAALRKNVRFRQKLATVPGFGHPVWIDDDKFHLNYHLRHTCLPAPGNVRLLKRLAGRIMSQQLDRGKPLWEIWFVEGVEGNHFAVITKIHHCLADGISGLDLISNLMGPDPNYKPKAAGEWIPRAAPSPGRLLADEVARRASLPLTALRAGGRLVSGARGVVDELRSAAEGLRQAAPPDVTPASETPFNSDVGPHRRLDWMRFDLDAIKRVKSEVDGKLNDVVLAVVAGAVRRFLIGRGLRADDLDFRAMVPVSVRDDSQRGALGNRVSMMVVPLPLAEKNARRRLERIVESTRELKKNDYATWGANVLSQLDDWTVPGLSVGLVRLGMRARTGNLVVTNVPGPPTQVFLLGAPMVANYPVVPLALNQAMGVALLSYDGGLYWGFNSDWDAFPDLHDLVEAVQTEFEELCGEIRPQERKPARAVSRRRSKKRTVRPKKRGAG